MLTDSRADRAGSILAGHRLGSYCVGVSIEVAGDDPLADGMRVALRLRRDFVVADAGRLLAAGRRAYVRLNPGASEQDAAEAVTCAADVVFTLLEDAGLIGDAADAALAGYESDGLALGGHRALVTFNDPWPLPVGPDCAERDVFALPPANRVE
ncbi:MAG: hypothetical protein JWM19_131 [Actinomycetia bacterium]|nr:hypothetical protein [Actinomycetes bacterium]